MTLQVAFVSFIVLVSMSWMCDESAAWHDETHLAIAKAAEYPKWYCSVGADMAKVKAGSLEKYNHYHDAGRNELICPRTVLGQVARYNDRYDTRGHVYGAIIGSLVEYRKVALKGKYAQYHLAYCAHYVGDLSQPLHNTEFDEFNRTRHDYNDGILEGEALQNITAIRKHMYPIRLRKDSLERDLAKEIARIANSARTLASRMRAQNRDMTKEEAYVQLGHSASLLRAILDAL